MQQIKPPSCRRKEAAICCLPFMVTIEVESFIITVKVEYFCHILVLGRFLGGGGLGRSRKYNNTDTVGNLQKLVYIYKAAWFLECWLLIYNCLGCTEALTWSRGHRLFGNNCLSVPVWDIIFDWLFKKIFFILDAHIHVQCFIFDF